MHYDKKHGAIYKSIEALDRMGMDIIETGDPDAFKDYLLEYDNTICGRHPISVFLHVSASNFLKVSKWLDKWSLEPFLEAKIFGILKYLTILSFSWFT